MAIRHVTWYRMLLPALLPLFLALPGCSPETPAAADLRFDLRECLLSPTAFAASGSPDLLCGPALAARLDEQTVACLVVAPHRGAGGVQAYRFAPQLGSFVPLPPAVPLELDSPGPTVFRLFVLRPGEGAPRCAAFDAATPCGGEDGPGASCLVAVGPAELEIDGRGPLEVTFRRGADGGPDACALQCNDPCDPAEESCLRLCPDEQHPWQELCNGLDDDCDGQADEGYELGKACDLVVGSCVTQGITSCSEDGRGIRCLGKLPVTADEVCDGVDNDCDGQTDEDFVLEGPDGPLAIGDPCPGTGECATGIVVCAADPAADRACCSASPDCGHLELEETQCDGLDNDCDGRTDEDLTAPAGFTCLSQGVCAGTGPHCGGALGWICPYPPGRWEGPDETSCDGLDNDCDGEVDEGLGLGEACSAPGRCGAGVRECGDGGQVRCSSAPGGTADASAVEECNGEDDDCDGSTDEGLQPPEGIDFDCLYLGVCAGAQPACLGQQGWGCAYSWLYEPVEARCDGLDNDCDGQTDEELALPPGFGCLSAGVCAGTEPTCAGELGWRCPYPPTHEQAAETLCDELDNDCDGTVDEGCPCQEPQEERPCGHGLGVCGTGRQICAAGQWSECVGAGVPTPESCDGLDNDCDGDTDEQVAPPAGSGCPDEGVCAGTEAQCEGEAGWVCPYPATWQEEETFCDGLDNDCDGAVDEGLELGQPCPASGAPGSPCGPGVWECHPQTRERICSTAPGGSQYPGEAETCNGQDDDCDGSVDEDFALAQVCPGTGGTGSPCIDGHWECDAAGGRRCSTHPGGSQYPGAAETCNGRDDDCDGAVDEDLGLGESCAGTGGPGSPCGEGVWECGEDGGLRCSTHPGGSQYPGGAELCNELDDDCDGAVDEDFGLGESCAGTGGPGSPCGEGVRECDVISAQPICSTHPGGSQYPGVAETCNAADDDCDGEVDEDLGTTLCGVGACQHELSACVDGAPPACDPRLGAAPEILDNGVDEDCDGLTDDNPCTGSERYWEGNGHCYWNNNSSSNWNAAKNACTNAGGYLVTIGSAAENSFVDDELLGRSNRWIGLSDTASEDHFVWVDGSPLTYTNWVEGEPNDWGTGEDCAAIYGSDAGDLAGQWNDTACSGNLRSICEADRVH